jgi:molybdopterin/thiamine biosynthesis adenylyltransferase
MNRPSAFREIRSPRQRAVPVRVARAERLPRFLGVQCDVGAALDKLRAAVFGCGSVGERIAVHLARLQAWVLWLVDPKSFQPASLLTTDVGSPAIGKPKVSVTGQRCKDISSATSVRAFMGAVQEVPLGELAGVDVLFLATDNLAAEVAAGQLARRLGRPLIQAAVHGDTLVAQVRTFGNQRADGPCPACGFSVAEWKQLQEQARFSCEGPVQGSASAEGQSTMSLSSLCSTAADLALNQALRFLLRLGKPVEDTQIEYCGYTNQMVTSPLRFNPECRCEHQLCTRVPASQPLAECSLQGVAGLAGLRLDGAPVVFTVAELCWVEAGVCGCSEPRLIRRFVRPGQKPPRCVKCRAPIQLLPFYMHRPVAASLLGDALATPLRQLGAKDVPWVLVEQAGQGILVHSPSIS